MFNNAATIITKEFILARVSEEDIFKKYLGLTPVQSGGFVNPLRPGDTHAGCGFYVDSRGVWKFKDHAAGFNWDCFNVIEYDYGCSFKEALFKVAADFNLIDNSDARLIAAQRATSKKLRRQLRVKRRAWTKEDYSFWMQYYITPERLYYFKVDPLQHAWFVDETGVLTTNYIYKKEDPCYCYHFGGYDYKLYFPLRERGKFLHMNNETIQGNTQLPETGTHFLYTKSFKDVMSIDVLGREFDLSSVAPMSENVVVPKDYHIDIYNRFDKIGTLFDFDRTGIRLTRKYEKTYNTESFFFGKQFRGQLFGKPQLKDFADHLKIKGIDETRRLIEQYVKRPTTGDVF